MNILGINYHYHDASACVVRDGQLVVALEEERFTRSKHTSNFPEKSIERCLSEAGLTLMDVHAVAISNQPALDWQKKCTYSLRHPRKSKSFAKYELTHYFWKQRAFWQWANNAWPDKRSRPEIHWVSHHTAHAAGTYYISPYESAAIISIDGSGEWASAMLGHGRGLDVQTFSPSYFPMSLGSVYESVTEFCGFQQCYDEGKTMGLAPLGDPERFYKDVSKIVHVDDDGRIHVDMSYFAYGFWEWKQCGPKFHKTFGEPRPKNKNAEFKQQHVDAAAAFQKVLEECCLKLARIVKARTKEKYLVMAGGVALNSVMNGRLIREADFEDLYVMPAAGDNGTSIGAAYHVLHGIHKKPKAFVHMNPYVGNAYTDQQIKKCLDECKLAAERHDDIEAVTAKLLRRGDIVGWFQGKMEIGPRALGNRSILADPTVPTMKDKINAQVKHREAFRPFAPSVTVEDKDTYFDLRVEDPFMLKVCNVRPNMKSVIPAITHVDGTARMQSVNKELNPRYHKLISEFGKLSGVPVVLNTSFNIMGEPIVESPIQAIRCFFSTGLDTLVLGNYLVRKPPMKSG